MKVIQKKKAKGDCFQRAFHLITEGAYKGQSLPLLQLGELKLCHGIVFHPETGFHIHGWVEDDVFAYDFLSSGLVPVLKERYYQIGMIQDAPGRLFRYTKKEAMKKASDTGYYYFSKLLKQL